MMKPQFQHDCDRCTFHGVLDGHDIYTCQSSIIARFGNDGPEYASAPNFVAWQMPGDYILRRAVSFADGKTLADILGDALKG